MSLDQFFMNKLSERTEKGLLRELKVVSGLIDFCSNDYLGLASSTDLFDLIQKKTEAILPIRNGSTGSRLLSGNFSYTEEVEKKLSKLFQCESTLIFNSGYTANMAVLSSIPAKGDTILYDELAHACIKDGARLSLATRHSFRHNDLGDLEIKIRKSIGKIFIAVESIYSMDGDQCPLAEIVELAQKHGAYIILDEAHSTGTYGSGGSGLTTSLNLSSQIDIRIHTFGKALGIHGACVAGSEKLKEYLTNFARPFIYTTALSPHNIASIDCAFEYLSQNQNLQKELENKISLFLSHTVKIENRIKSNSAIQSVIFSGNEKTKKAANKLQQAGFDVRPILSPTVAAGKERLRICLHTFNNDEEILNLCKALNHLVATD